MLNIVPGMICEVLRMPKMENRYPVHPAVQNSDLPHHPPGIESQALAFESARHQGRNQNVPQCDPPLAGKGFRIETVGGVWP